MSKASLRDTITVQYFFILQMFIELYYLLITGQGYTKVITSN